MKNKNKIKFNQVDLTVEDANIIGISFVAAIKFKWTDHSQEYLLEVGEQFIDLSYAYQKDKNQHGRISFSDEDANVIFDVLFSTLDCMSRTCNENYDEVLVTYKKIVKIVESTLTIQTK